MNWFQHDADSTQDAKIKKLLIRHGAVGYAIYFHCLELIISDVCETNITFELEHDSEIIADNLKIKGTGDKSGREIVEDIMRTIVELGLFTNDDGHIFCYKLLKRINMSMTSNKNLREAIARAKDDNHDSIMTNHDNVMMHHATYLPTYLPTNQPTIPTEGKNKNFIIPTYNEVKEYCNERSNIIDPEQFIDYYTSKGWMIGKNKMKDWKAAMRTWERNNKDKQPKTMEPHEPIKCECGGYFNAGGFCTKCGKEIS